MNNTLYDSSFLKQLDSENLRTYYARIVVLDKISNISNNVVDAAPQISIEGRVSGGTISIDGNSSVRRSGNITFLAEEKDNDLSDIDNLLSMNKKIQIFIGLENHVNSNYEDIIWFNQGIFIITQPNLTHSLNGVIVNLQFKDKMCLLNGELGGNLPTSVTFNEYDQYIGYIEIEYSGNIENAFAKEPNNYSIYGYKNKIDGTKKYYSWSKTNGWLLENDASKVGSYITIENTIFDIILTLVNNYGGEDISKIIINDIPREQKNQTRYIGEDTLYYNSATKNYSTVKSSETDIKYGFNETCGYRYADFVYAGSLISNIGDNVCTILDKIKELLGNFEYYYDIDGNFIFQEIKNYLNKSYNPIQDAKKTTNLSFMKAILYNDKENLNGNYYVDFSSFNKTTYSFEKNNNLVVNYANTLSYQNIKNDFHIWGKFDNNKAIHYHIAIKEKPKNFGTYFVMNDPFGEGRIRMATANEVALLPYINLETLMSIYLLKPEYKDSFYSNKELYNEVLRLLSNEDFLKVKEETLKIDIKEVGLPYAYTPTDWRAELYLRGLEKISKQQRPDIYEQELLDLFDTIYNMQKKEYKVDIVNNPNELNYWIDFLDPINELHDISVDVIGPKIYSYQKDKINKLYEVDVPNVIMINKNQPKNIKDYIIEKCNKDNIFHTFVDDKIYNKTVIPALGYSAQMVARELIYQYIDYISSINLSTIPIYHLDVNNRISVMDPSSKIYGDYIIKTINLPLDGKNNMSITATKALERV